MSATTPPPTPAMIPRLVQREVPITPEGSRPAPAPDGSWGSWNPIPDGPLLAAGGPWGAAEWLQPESATSPGGYWTPVTDVFRGGPGGFDPQNGDRIEWGAWGNLDGLPALAVGGFRSGSADLGGLWLWDGDSATLMPFEASGLIQPLWGVWGRIDGEGVLATGSANGEIRLWDPLARRVRLVLPTGSRPQGPTWGAWCDVDGEPLLAVGSEYLALWSADSLRGNTSSAGNGLSVGGSPRMTWGTWGLSNGVPTLASGDVTGTVHLLDLRAMAETTFVPPLGTPAWGTWGEIAGRSMLVMSAADMVWFHDPREGTDQIVTLGRIARWSSWGRLNGKAVLAVADHKDIWLYDLVWEQAMPRVPSYRSDSGTTVDLLERRRDASALADVITARSVRPPLAVGLFGEWGAGKSVFLEMLQEQVSERSRQAGLNDPIAHGQVRQVRFNAWHYAEADLWASLVAELFAQLSDDAADPRREQRQRSRLASELVQARGLRERLAAAEDRLAELRSADPDSWTGLRPSARRRLEDFFGADAERAYREFTATASISRRTVRALARLPKAISWRGWLLAAGAVAVALALWSSGLTRWAAALPAVGTAAGLVGAAVHGWDRTKPARETISSGWKMVRRIRDEQEQRLETAEAVARAEVEELRNRVQNLTSAGQLAGVVQEHAGASTYRQRLGLMTQIRQDFEQMAELLRPDEFARNDVPVEDAAGDELPAIDRIVIYIDDLDRCPPDRVIDVLEAVHLLLAVRLFVVVVAVDPRWLLRSLASHYRELFEEADDELRSSTPAQYLEKIFQIVLTLPPMEQTGYQRMIEDLVGLREPVRSVRPDASAEPDAPTRTARPDAAEASSDRTVRDPVDLSSRIVERVDPLALTPDEFELINLLGPPLVSGPRSVKRLANSYGLLVSTRSVSGGLRADLEPVPDLDGSVTLPYRAGMVLLAAVIGYPMLGSAFFPDLHSKARSNPFLPWREYLIDLSPNTADDGSTGNRLEQAMTETRARQWRHFLSALRTIGERADLADLPLPGRLSIWADWVVPVGRLSFPTGSSVAKLVG